MMDSRVVDRKVRCPYCAEQMHILLDMSAGDQTYIEDCRVCCQPMQVSFQTAAGELTGLQVDCAA